MSKRLVLAALFLSSLSAVAAETSTAGDAQAPTVVAGVSDHTSTNLLTALDGFLRQRKVDVDSLTVDQMVAVMIDWYRFAPVDPAEGDTLVYRYGGWSEGCATAFKLSLLRRVTEGGADRIAGITMMFEPSSRSEIAPFMTTSSDWKSIEAFLEAVQGSPAFRQFGSTKPMGVMIERGGLR